MAMRGLPSFLGSVCIFFTHVIIDEDSSCIDMITKLFPRLGEDHGSIVALAINNPVRQGRLAQLILE